MTPTTTKTATTNANYENDDNNNHNNDSSKENTSNDSDDEHTIRVASASRVFFGLAGLLFRQWETQFALQAGGGARILYSIGRRSSWRAGNQSNEMRPLPPPAEQGDEEVLQQIKNDPEIIHWWRGTWVELRTRASGGRVWFQPKMVEVHL